MTKIRFTKVEGTANHTHETGVTLVKLSACNSRYAVLIPGKPGPEEYGSFASARSAGVKAVAEILAN